MADALIFGSLNDKALETKIAELSVSLAAAKIERRSRRGIGKTPKIKASSNDRKVAESLGIGVEQIPFLKAMLTEAQKLAEAS
jgi:branched-subunit amino acid ABC-type transport system permease component